MPVDADTFPDAVEHEIDLDVGLLGDAVLVIVAGVAGGHVAAASWGPCSRRTSVSADRNALFSAAVPTVTRRQSSTPGQREKSRTSTPRSTRLCQTRCAGSTAASPAPGRHPEQQEVRAGREHRDAVELVERREHALPLLDEECVGP